MVIANENVNHAWNCLYVNHQWYELDFTGVTQPYTDGEQILVPVTYGTRSGDKISSEWFDFMKELYKDNTAAAVAPTQQIPNTIYGAPAIRVNINGQDAALLHAPVLNAGKVYAVYEDIAQAYGASVIHDGSNWVTLSKGGVDLKFSLNTNAGTIIHVKAPTFKRQITFGGKPYWSNGSFYVPIADIIKGLNLHAEVSWKPEEGCIYITE